jgi:hypothetical protein
MENIILNLGNIDEVSEFERHAREALLNLAECAPYDSLLTASVNRYGDNHVVSLRLKSKDLDLRDSQVDTCPYIALDQAIYRIRDEIYAWWDRRFDYVSCAQ